MVYCPRCNTDVGVAEAATIRLKGMCTSCHLHSLSDAEEQRRRTEEMDWTREPAAVTAAT